MPLNPYQKKDIFVLDAEIVTGHAVVTMFVKGKLDIKSFVNWERSAWSEIKKKLNERQEASKPNLCDEEGWPKFHNKFIPSDFYNVNSVEGFSAKLNFINFSKFMKGRALVWQ